jgi:hypothetical protein
VPGSDEAVWGSASSHGRGSNTAAGSDTAVTEDTGSSSETTYSSETELTDTTVHPTGGALGSAPTVPQQQQQQQLTEAQQAQAASVLSAAQSWLSQHFRAAGSAVVRSLGRQLSSALNAVSNRLSLRVSFPPPALHSVVVSQGRLDVAVWGEPIQRCVRDVGVLVTLGPDYSWLDVQVEGEADPRHPASIKCTGVNPNNKRHLRHVTPGTGTRLRKFSCDVLLPPEEQPAAAAGAEPAVQRLLAVEGPGGGFAAAAGAAAVSESEAVPLGAAAGPGGGVSRGADADGQAGHDPHSPSEQHQQQEDDPRGSAAATAAAESHGGPSVSTNSPAIDAADDTQQDMSSAGHSSSSSNGAHGLPLTTLQLVSGQQGATHTISFLLPEELQQGTAPATGLVQQKGRRHVSTATQGTQCSAGGVTMCMDPE